MDNKKAIDKITIVDKFIHEKYLLIDTKKYQVALLDNFWALYENEKQVNLCLNLKYYCDIKNSYNGDVVNSEANLLISLKYENNEVVPHAYFDGEKVIRYEEESQKLYQKK